MDLQIVRTALKSLRDFKNNGESLSKLTPFSSYLRFLNDDSPVAVLDRDISVWSEPLSCINLLQWRAARLVGTYQENAQVPDPMINQRVSRAVSEAFVADQVKDILANMSLKGRERQALTSLLMLVRPLHQLFLILEKVDVLVTVSVDNC